MDMFTDIAPCGCGKSARYLTDNGYACNKSKRCPTYDELGAALIEAALHIKRQEIERPTVCFHDQDIIFEWKTDTRTVRAVFSDGRSYIWVQDKNQASTISYTELAAVLENAIGAAKET